MQVTKTNKIKSEVTQWKYLTQRQDTRNMRVGSRKLKRENLKTKLKRVLIEEILLHENNAKLKTPNLKKDKINQKSWPQNTQEIQGNKQQTASTPLT